MKAQQRIYRAGLYLRLSKDDENSGESSSISTQRNILQEFAKAHNIIIKDEYVDDGFSGTNYDRPDFQRMISDIENGVINCVITKDLSRLGRNSSKTSELLDEYFPSHGVRYIAVIEGYDTFNLTNGSIMTAPFMLLMNEMYARDISNKIRSSFQAKMEKGEYIGSFAPYGYKKDIEHGNKNHLVIDYQVSHIVQEMFQMAVEGHSPKEIAEHLNNKGVVTPAVYRCLSRPYLDVDNYSKRKAWTSSIVCKMLKNRVYLGHTQQGKTRKVSFKSKCIQANKEHEWIEVQNTHEPIITDEIYNIVRNRSVARRNKPTKDFTNIFSGIAKCADCGRNMTTAPTRKKGCTYNLACGGYKSYGARECSNHFIDYDLLYNTVLQEIQLWLSLSQDDRNAIIEDLEKAEQSPNKDVLNTVQAIKRLEQRTQEVSLLIKKAYEDFSFGRMPEGIYSNLSKEYETEYQSLEQSINEMKKSLQTDTSKSNSYNDFFALLDEITKVDTLSVALLNKLIDRIEIGQGYYQKDDSGKKIKHQYIKIYYRFIGCTDETS